MPSLRQYVALVRHLGPRWVLFRAGYAWRRKNGGLRRATPLMPWDGVPSPELNLGRSAPRLAEVAPGDGCMAEAEAVLRGEFQLFSHRTVNAGTIPDWHRNQLTGESVPAGRHWTELGDFAFGDIKGVWELSRFAWAFALARTHVRTAEPRYADAFWRLFGDWCERNPPNLGPNWMCGQEATFRLMAVVFTAEVLGVPDARRDLLARFVTATGRRIAANLDYALSQKNNHGISECVGLITTALVLPGHAESRSWLRRGLRELEGQLAELVYADGGFSQHSLIYHRVLLHDLSWVKSRLRAAGESSPGWLDAVARRALRFLLTMTDPATGLAPLYGSNDGANVLPLADASFLDMRPTVQLMAAMLGDNLPLGPGFWDETAAWLTGPVAGLRRENWPVPPERWHASDAGCCQLVNGAGRLFLRCPTRFRHRPAQADLLHVDVWHDGRPVAMDGGSFSYNSRERFAALGAAAQHNALIVDGLEPVEKFSRFLYLPWPKGTTGEGNDGNFQAEHDGYAKLGVRWVRRVSAQPDGGFTVEDRVEGGAGHTLRWHWRLAAVKWQLSPNGCSVYGRLPDGEYRVAWDDLTGAQVQLIEGDPETAAGWWSPHYGEVEPACSLILTLPATADVTLRTQFSPQA